MALDPNHKTHRHRGNPPVNQPVTGSHTLGLILVIYSFNMWMERWGNREDVRQTQREGEGEGGKDGRRTARGE